METKTIVFFRTGIGNFVLFTPALQAIASMDPSGKVDMCTDAEWSDYRKVPLIDLWEKYLFVNKILAFKEIDKSKYSTWFWTYWTCQGEARKLFKSKKHYEPPNWDQNIEHESDYYMRMVTSFYGYKGTKPNQCVIPADNPKINTDLKKVVLCNGGFGDITVLKKWDFFDRFAEEAKRYFDDITLIKVGYGNELAGVKADLDFVGKLTLSQTAYVIKQADIIITTDTGNMHIADALGTPLIVLWGGSSVEKNKPIQAKNKIIYLKLPCQPCQQDGIYRTCQDRDCLSGITVGEVMFHLRQFLKKGEFNGDT